MLEGLNAKSHHLGETRLEGVALTCLGSGKAELTPPWLDEEKSVRPRSDETEPVHPRSVEAGTLSQELVSTSQVLGKAESPS